MAEKNIYLFVIKSANHSMSLYRILIDKGYNAKIISTPCSISRGCSRSVVVSCDTIEEIKKLIEDNNIIVRDVYIKQYNRYSYRYVKLN